VADQRRSLDDRVVEHARDIVGEIFDRHSTRIARRGSSTVTSIMRVQTKPIG
jgi:hypothetical protein